MQIDKIFYPITSLGYGKRIGIWTVGCPHKCKNCSNPELWNRDNSKEIFMEDIINFIRRINGRIDGVTISGGEPFFQYEELLDLIKEINSFGIRDILIYSGYTKEQLVSMKYDEVFEYISALVDGRYEDELNYNKGLMGSENQHIYVFNDEFAERYTDFRTRERTAQNVINNSIVHSFGIPLKKE